MVRWSLANPAPPSSAPGEHLALASAGEPGLPVVGEAVGFSAAVRRV
jgi:hypothetical protein